MGSMTSMTIIFLFFKDKKEKRLETLFSLRGKRVSPALVDVFFLFEMEN
jgi:hypothetical protein